MEYGAQGPEAADAADAAASGRGTPDTEQLVDVLILEASMEDAALAGVAGMDGLLGLVPSGEHTEAGDLYPPDEAHAREADIAEDDIADAVDSLLQDVLEDI